MIVLNLLNVLTIYKRLLWEHEHIGNLIYLFEKSIEHLIIFTLEKPYEYTYK